MTTLNHFDHMLDRMLKGDTNPGDEMQICAHCAEIYIETAIYCQGVCPDCHEELVSVYGD